jgi:hypothetical protein
MKLRFFAGYRKFSAMTRQGVTGVVEGVIVETG